MARFPARLRPALYFAASRGFHRTRALGGGGGGAGACCAEPVLAPGQDWGQPGGGGRPGQPEPREGPSQRPVAVVPGADGNFVSWCARSDFQHIQKAALSLSGKPR